MTQQLEVQHVAIGKLFCSPANPRKNDAAVPHVAASLRRFGWRQPVVAKRSGEVLAGNTRLKAAQSLGMEQVPVVWFDGPNLDATAYAIADNRTSEFAEWHEGELSRLLTTLQQEDALEGVGYSQDEIAELVRKVELESRPPVQDPGDVEPPTTPTTREGDVWILGDHRVLCGDSTREADVMLLMERQRAVVMQTDPPYGVSHVATKDGMPIGGFRDMAARWEHILNDDLQDEHLQRFLESAFRAASAHALVESAAWYLWHAHLTQGFFAAAAAAAAADVLLHRQIIWVKPSLVLTRSGQYHWRHEPCFYGWRRGHPPAWYGDKCQTSVWEIGRDHGGIHPTQKPVEIWKPGIANHTKPGEILYEPFAGSGSQVIAAEQEGRRCFAMELSPHFCDAIVARWQTATAGREARHATTGETFADTARSRGTA